MPLKPKKERTSLKVTLELSARKNLANYTILFEKLLINIKKE